MVSLKSFKHYFSRQVLPAGEAPVDGELLDQLMCCFGGRDNIQHVDACLTRLRVTVKSLAAVDTARITAGGGDWRGDSGTRGACDLRDPVRSFASATGDTLLSGGIKKWITVTGYPNKPLYKRLIKTTTRR